MLTNKEAKKKLIQRPNQHYRIRHDKHLVHWFKRNKQKNCKKNGLLLFFKVPCFYRGITNRGKRTLQNSRHEMLALAPQQFSLWGL